MSNRRTEEETVFGRGVRPHPPQGLGDPGVGRGPVGGAGEAGGLTLEEIRSIATEAGIDPEAVTRAASILGALEWDGKRRDWLSAIFGGPEQIPSGL